MASKNRFVILLPLSHHLGKTQQRKQCYLKRHLGLESQQQIHILTYNMFKWRTTIDW